MRVIWQKIARGAIGHRGKWPRARSILLRLVDPAEAFMRADEFAMDPPRSDEEGWFSTPSWSEPIGALDPVARARLPEHSRRDQVAALLSERKEYFGARSRELVQRGRTTVYLGTGTITARLVPFHHGVKVLEITSVGRNGDRGRMKLRLETEDGSELRSAVEGVLAQKTLEFGPDPRPFSSPPR
jgi:hypothetical protein